MGYKPRAKKSNKVVKKSTFMSDFNKALIRSSLIEQKRHRGTFSLSVSTTPSLVSVLSGLTQGLGDLAVRTGDEISITKFEFHYSALLADTTNLVRLIIFFWNDNNATAPVANDILDDSSTSLTQLFGPLNEDNLKSKRFRVIVDKRLTLYNSKNYMGGSIIKHFNKAHTVVFSGGSSTVGRGMPYIMLMSDSAAVAHPTFDAYHVSHYTDL